MSDDTLSCNHRVMRHAESTQRLREHRPQCRTLLPAVVAIIASSFPAMAQQLPPGGTTTWEIPELEVIVTFLLFDPADPAVALPEGLRFVTAREVDAPEFQEHLRLHPEQSGWAFSFVEFARPEAWLLDGKALALPENGGIGVWFAPVDHALLAAEVATDSYEAVIAPSPDAVLVLGLWIPDREYVDYMRARGHHAEYGSVTLTEDSDGTFHGELQLAALNVKASATPRGEARHEPAAFTQVFFEPGAEVGNVVILAGRNARERDATATWSKEGDHPLARGAFLGPTFVTVEGPLEGSAYRIGGKE